MTQETDQLASKVLGISSIVAATTLAWTVSRKSKSNYIYLYVETIALMNNSIFSLKNPKAAAYIFAGQAFGTATVLVACGGFTLAVLVSMMMDVSNMGEFHHKMTSWAHTAFPKLHASKDYDEDKESTLEFVREWISALDEPEQETETSKHVSKQLKRGLGLD